MEANTLGQLDPFRYFVWVSYAAGYGLADGYLDLIVNSANFLVLIGSALCTAKLWFRPAV